MKIAFRVDSSTEIGSGHLIRCITLADQLRHEGDEVLFICRDHPGHLGALLRQHQYHAQTLKAPSEGDLMLPGADIYASWLGVSQDRDAEDTVRALREAGEVDWLVMDHYALDAVWQKGVRRSVRKVFVIDDLANRSHVCDVLLDQNLAADGPGRYRGLVPGGCRLLCGPGYSLLRREFQTARLNLRKRDGRVRRIMVFYGGVDKTGETLKACRALGSLKRADLAVDVVAGSGNPHQEEIRQVCDRHRFDFLGQVDNMAELMAAADLALGAGGTTTYERAYLGLPCLLTAVADNQVPGSEAMASAGAAWYVGRAQEATVEGMARTIGEILGDPAAVREAGERGYGLFGDDRLSGVERVTQVMRSMLRAQA